MGEKKGGFSCEAGFFLFLKRYFCKFGRLFGNTLSKYPGFMSQCPKQDTNSSLMCFWETIKLNMNASFGN